MMFQLFLFYSFLAKLTLQLRPQNETEEMMDDIMLPPATGSLATTRQLSDCASPLWIEQMYREQADENVVEYDCIVAGSDLAPPRLFDRVQNTGSSHLAYSMPQMVYYNRLAVITLSISRGDEEAPIGLRGPFIMDTTSSSVVYQEDISVELLTSEGLFVTHEGTCFESRVEVQPLATYAVAPGSRSSNLTSEILPFMIRPGSLYPPWNRVVLVRANDGIASCCADGTFVSIPVLTGRAEWMVNAQIAISDARGTFPAFSAISNPYIINTASAVDVIPSAWYNQLMLSITSRCTCRRISVVTEAIVHFENCNSHCFPDIRYTFYNRNREVVQVIISGTDYTEEIETDVYRIFVRPASPLEPLSIGTSILQNTVGVFESNDTIGFCDPL